MKIKTRRHKRKLKCYLRYKKGAISESVYTGNHWCCVKFKIKDKREIGQAKGYKWARNRFTKKIVKNLHKTN